MTADKKMRRTEFREFMALDPDAMRPSQDFSTKLTQRLFPNPWLVFGKVVLVHLVFGLLSLSVCSQFGLDPFGTKFSISDWLMKIGGNEFCMGLCGVLFMTSTYLFSNLFLDLEELETIKHNKWVLNSVLGLISLAAFYFFGAELVLLFTLLWFLGAMVGGILSVELSYRLRHAWTMG